MHPVPGKVHYKLKAKTCTLVPYESKYVPAYHQFFEKDLSLLQMTGTQKLTLEQQKENQKSWLTDPSKYTFLVITREEGGDEQLIGDINLFFSQWIEQNQAEINIMIAVKQKRGKGIAADILTAIHYFARAIYDKTTIIAKIKDQNAASIKFFQKQHYKFIAHNHHHGEVEYRVDLPYTKQEAMKILQNQYYMETVHLLE